MPNAQEIPDDYLKEIGRIAIAWNFVENAANMVLIDLMGLDYWDLKSHAPFARMNFNQRLDVLITLRRHVPGNEHELTQHYSSMMAQKIKEAQGKRNRLIHCFWLPGPKGITYNEFKTSGNLEFFQTVISLESLKRTSEEISDCSAQLFKLFVDIKAAKSKPKPQLGQNLNRSFVNE